MKQFHTSIMISLSAVTLFVTACGVDNEYHNDKDGYKILSTYGGRQLTNGQVAKLLRDQGFNASAVNKLTCTAQYESRNYTGARNVNTNGSIDIGLFQINSVNFEWCTGSSGSAAEELLKDAATNTACAYKVAGGADAKYITRWYGYQSHQAECDAYIAPASQPL